MTKICTTCKIEKKVIEFSSHPLGKFGVRSKCKLCSTKEAISYNNKHKEERKQYYLNNKEKLLKQHKDYHINNKDHIKEQTKLYREKHKNVISKRITKWCKNQRSINPNFKLKDNLRRRLNCALKNNQKSGHTLELLGCSIEFLKKHLESQFKEGMVWDNHNLRGWHIDHIYPCVSFDLSKPEEQAVCFHWSNLQPLWWYENLEKRAKL